MLARLLFALLLPLPAVSSLPAQEIGYVRVMQGPILGAVTPESALIWARTSHRAPVTVRYGIDPWLADARISESVTPAPEDDRTVVARLSNLTHVFANPRRRAPRLTHLPES